MSGRLTPQRRLAKLSQLLDRARSMLIVTQNNPDPDAIAAAAALREIAKSCHGTTCTIAHAGAIGRAENQALVRYLGLNTRSVAELDAERFDRVAMVDAQPGAGNVSFDTAVRLDLVIDHHPIRRETRSARLTDIRSRYGATSTILHEYLEAAGIDIPTSLATALVYGIRSDTQDLGRETTRADVEAFLALYPKANPRALGRIVSAPLPRSYFAMLRVALDRAVVHGSRVVSFLGPVRSQEIIAETADMLLRVEGAVWVMVLGTLGGWLNLSLRTTDRERHAGKIARNLAGREGFGGGHQTLAAAQIELSNGPDPARTQRVIAALTRRFLRATGGAEPGEPLCEHGLSEE